MEKIGTVLCVLVFGKVICQSCEFPSALQQTSWHSSVDTLLTFTNDTLSGYAVTIYTTRVSEWTCLDTSDTTIALQSKDTVELFSRNFFYAYVCLELTQVTDAGYTYIVHNEAEKNANYERMALTLSSAPLTSIAGVCNFTITIPDLEFHVLVKQGMESSAAVTFPDTFLFSGDFYVTRSGNVYCNDTSDNLNMCSNNTMMSISKENGTCTEEVAFSIKGSLACVAKVTSNGLDCAVVFNNDDNPTIQFACLCTDGDSISVSSSNCETNQNATYVSNANDNHVIYIETKYETCVPQTTTAAEEGSDSSSSIVIIVVVILILLVIIVVVILLIFLWKKGLLSAIAAKCICCKNKIHQDEKDVEEAKEAPEVEATDDTAAAPKLLKGTTAISGITRSSTAVERQMTVTSIDIDIKKDITLVEEADAKARFLSLFKCCSKQEDAQGKRIVVEPLPTKKDLNKDEGMIGATAKPQKSTKVGNKATKGKAKTNKKGKKGKDKKSSSAKEMGNENEDINEIKEENIDEINDSQLQIQNEKTEITEDNEIDAEVPRNEKAGKKESKSRKTKQEKKGKKTPKGKTSEEKTSEEDTEINGNVANESSNRDLPVTSTPVPEKKNKKVISLATGTANMLKPQETANEWRFLSCCFGNRSPPPGEPKENGHLDQNGNIGNANKQAQVKQNSSAKPKTKKGKTKGTDKKTINKESKKKHVELVVEQNKDDEGKPVLSRAKTMPDREKTALSAADADKIQVNVYIPDENTVLPLKDTVTLQSKKKPQKSKTTLGTVTQRETSALTVTDLDQTDHNADSKVKNTKKGQRGKPTPKKKKKK